MKKNNGGKIIIYQSESGGIDFHGDFNHDNIWGTQKDIAKLFNKDRTVITKHINKILEEKEVDKESNVQKMHIANSDKPVIFYSLDIILAVGYRTNSKQAMKFRIWASKIIKEYLIDGYVINKKVISKNHNSLLEAIENIKKLSRNNKLLGSSEALDLVKAFANTWVSLEAYDEQNLPKYGATKKDIKFTAEELEKAIFELKNNLIKKKEATELFAQEKKSGNFAGIVGNIFQSFGGDDLYPTIEEKAVHLLYFVVKNHVFNDGNKRSGAFSFIWFLQKAGILNKENMTSSALTALTILIAESNPRDKDKMIGLTLLLLKK